MDKGVEGNVDASARGEGMGVGNEVCELLGRDVGCVGARGERGQAGVNSIGAVLKCGACGFVGTAGGKKFRERVHIGRLLRG